MGDSKADSSGIELIVAGASAAGYAGDGPPRPNDTDSDDFTSSDEGSDGDYDYDEEVLTGWPAARAEINRFVDSRAATILMAVVTFYALFGDDARLAVFPKEADVVFMVLSSISFFLFAIELVLNSLGKTDCVPRSKTSGGWRERFLGVRGYLLSFFFLLDFVATLSLLPEITWIWGPITGEPLPRRALRRRTPPRAACCRALCFRAPPSQYPGLGAPPRLAGDDNGEATNLNAARAGRVSRAGSKAGRIIRMVRLVRLVKLYMLARRQNDKSHKQSKVGAKLSDLTTRRVIVVVLVMLIVVPVFSYSEDDFSEEFATDQLHVFNLVRPVRVLYAVRCAAPARGAGPSPWPRCVCVRAWRNKQSHWEAAIDQMKATFLYWEGNVDDPRLVKLNIAPTIASTFTVDKPEIYDDLRTGLAGNELKKVFYETQQGGTTYITEAWFDQKVGGAPARRRGGWCP